jgi:class 3 adenylate cyclase
MDPVLAARMVMFAPILARLRVLPAVLRPLFRLDYSLTQLYLRYIGALASGSYIVFHFLESGMGYRDWLPLRVACVAVPLALLFYPRHRKLTWAEIVYYELSGWLLLPVAQSFLFLLNEPDAYWSSSITYVGLGLGLLTKPFWFPIHLVTGLAAGAGLYTLTLGPPDPESLRYLIRLQANSASAGLIAMVVQLGLHAFHRRGIELAEAKTRALEASLANEELRRREQVITRFVRPSLCAELAAGRDPTDFEPVEKELAVLFCDLRDFTALTEILGPQEKLVMLNRYFSLMTHPMVEAGGEVDKIMGDCVMGLFPDGRSAAAAAMGMRLRLQECNAELIARGKPRIRNGIGIAKGPVLMGNFGSHEKLDRTVIGEAVNIASRLESKTKMYNLEVVVTEDVIRDVGLEGSHWRWIDLVQVKGSSRNLRIFELYGHQPPAVREYKDRTRGMLDKALTIYFRKGFRDALRLFEAMRKEVPPHLHVPDELMDNLLDYYIDRCRAWIRDDPGAWERIERWQGVHVFLDK